jgi:uncharacterized protein (TIGR02147 family)
MQAHCYREILKRHFAERLEENPRYSLRAFSRDLSISPSRLSEILNGKQGLSGEWAEKISSRLQMNSREAEDFYQKVLASDARAKGVRRAAIDRLESRSGQEYLAVQADTFKIIADWYHFALMELTKLKSFRPSSQWIAKKLGISVYEAKLAGDRLARLGLMEKNRGRWRLTNKTLTTSNGVPSEAIRKFNRQILEKSREAIALQSVEERDISSLTLAVRRKDIPQVIEKIRRFRREINSELEQSVPEGAADEVYSLAIQFFRLTEKERA